MVAQRKPEDPSRLLISEKAMQVLPSLAVVIGLEEAIVLQQVHYWLTLQEEAGNKYVFKDGRYWVYNSVKEWKEKQFKWWSERTITRIIETLEAMELLVSVKFDAGKWNQTKWYAVNYENMRALALTDKNFTEKKRSDKIKLVRAEIQQNRSLPNCHNGVCQTVEPDYDNLANSLSEITPEIKSKINGGADLQSAPSLKSAYAQTKKEDKAELQVDGDGWIVFPKGREYVQSVKLAKMICSRVIAVHAKFGWVEEDYDGEVRTSDGQVVFTDYNGEEVREDDLFASHPKYTIKALRDMAYKQGKIDKSSYNDLFRTAWGNAIKYLEKAKRIPVGSIWLEMGCEDYLHLLPGKEWIE